MLNVLNMKSFTVEMDTLVTPDTVGEVTYQYAQYPMSLLKTRGPQMLFRLLGDSQTGTLCN